MNRPRWTGLAVALLAGALASCAGKSPPPGSPGALPGARLAKVHLEAAEAKEEDADEENASEEKKSEESEAEEKEAEEAPAPTEKAEDSEEKEAEEAPAAAKPEETAAAPKTEPEQPAPAPAPATPVATAPPPPPSSPPVATKEPAPAAPRPAAPVARPAPPPAPPKAAPPPAAAKPAAGARYALVAVPAPAKKTERLWKAKCSSCHGSTGKGDTEKGRKLQLTDLSTASWQTSKTNAQVRTAIADGVSVVERGVKKEMDPFKEELSADELDSLVQLVRWLGAPR